MIRLSSVVNVTGPFAAGISGAVGEAGIAPTNEQAADASRDTRLTGAPAAGEQFRGPKRISRDVFATISKVGM